MADRVFGHIPDNPVGTSYYNRQAAADAGVHRPLQGGICGGEDGAESIVVSGGYVDDQDHGDVIVYTGQGGRHPDTGHQIEDQQLTRGNLGLARSYLEGLPVRVIRGHEGDPAYSPPSGYRYDGLFRVDEYWQETGRDGFQIWRFRLVSIDETSPQELVTDAGTPQSPGRIEATIQRIVRNNKMAEKLKTLHRHTCQVCGLQLTTPAGPYAEAAHIRALGVPHNGPDVLENLLCLCPNDHVRFDTGAIYIDDNHRVIESGSDTPLGVLRLRPGHIPDRNYLAYHREHFGGQLDSR